MLMVPRLCGTSGTSRTRTCCRGPSLVGVLSLDGSNTSFSDSKHGASRLPSLARDPAFAEAAQRELSPEPAAQVARIDKGTTPAAAG